MVGTRTAQALLGFQGTSVLLIWRVVMESGDPALLGAVFVEHKACLNVLLLSAVHGVFLECQTQMLMLGISGKS